MNSDTKGDELKPFVSFVRVYCDLSCTHKLQSMTIRDYGMYRLKYECSLFTNDIYSTPEAKLYT